MLTHNHLQLLQTAQVLVEAEGAEEVAPLPEVVPLAEAATVQVRAERRAVSVAAARGAAPRTVAAVLTVGRLQMLTLRIL